MRRVREVYSYVLFTKFTARAKQNTIKEHFPKQILSTNLSYLPRVFNVCTWSSINHVNGMHTSSSHKFKSSKLCLSMCIYDVAVTIPAGKLAKPFMFSAGYTSLRIIHVTGVSVSVFSLLKSLIVVTWTGWTRESTRGQKRLSQFDR